MVSISGGLDHMLLPVVGDHHSDGRGLLSLIRVHHRCFSSKHSAGSHGHRKDAAACVWPNMLWQGQFNHCSEV